MKVSGWGNYPIAEADFLLPTSTRQCQSLLSQFAASDQACVARGFGRSYGDSSLADRIICTRFNDQFRTFDQQLGHVTCKAGVSLATILETFIPKGWFLPVTPGTKFVSIGGAIAADVHGKNHHLEGSFCDYVESIKVLLASGDVVTCSREQQSDLFYATCGGMGLTGVILEACLRLKAINSSYINETTYKAENLAEVVELFDQFNECTYTVAWIDCVSGGDRLGRSLLMVGEHDTDGVLDAGNLTPKLSVPFNMPDVLLNKYSIQAFNTAYYHRVRKKESSARVHYNPFFYPLDGIHHWNRLYGKKGFVQYQFVLPYDSGLPAMQAILQKIVDTKKGSFLAVLKALGKANDNLLSFCQQGLTLALDFKYDNDILDFLSQLDSMVIEAGGKIYLAKDARMSAEMFRKCYPRYEEFMAVREKYGATQVFNSHQSRRLGL